MSLTALLANRGCNHVFATHCDFEGRMTTKGDLYHLLKCPLCEGRGELEKTELLDRLGEKDLGRKLASYVDTFIVADEKEAESEAVAAEQAEFKHRVDAWNCTHFLWRRSPKE